MTSAELRQSFLDFFREKEHTIVPSSPLLPESPGLLFTNAGMNQFVPIFLNELPCPYQPPRAADTQKCIRAGGKHNDLEDVGLDTYHHTFFEMLGNWSFGDYFKKEAISWAWELIVDRWHFPPQRLYATVYQPGPGDPAEFDQEAHDTWAALFSNAGLDPATHIVGGNKKDNFWMMGETGPCGPCSELHVDLTPEGNTRGSLVNAGDPRCIEIWNLVFIQFNALPDGSFRPLPARHVDTGMGFERACSIIQCTRNFTDFTRPISNYETDVFSPIFRKLEQLSGHTYTSTLPAHGLLNLTEPQRRDIAFRVIADHIRTLSLSIADGILPGNNGRNYVLRRILRRAVLWSRALGLHEPFFYKLVPTVVDQLSPIFPELKKNQSTIEKVLKAEEENFNRTLDKGIALFNAFLRDLGNADVPSGLSPHAQDTPDRNADVPSAPPDILSGGDSQAQDSAGSGSAKNSAGRDVQRSGQDVRAPGAKYWKRRLPHYEKPWGIYHITYPTKNRQPLSESERTLVLEAWKHFHPERYRLISACVMPDHVHVLIQPCPKEVDASGNPIFWSLAELVQSIKSFTAKQIHKQRGTAGTLWEAEYHDRLIRSDRELQAQSDYILSNPWRNGIVVEGQDYPHLFSEGHANIPPGDTSHPRNADVSSAPPDILPGDTSPPGNADVSSAPPDILPGDTSHPRNADVPSAPPDILPGDTSHPRNADVSSAPPDILSGDTSHPRNADVSSAPPDILSGSGPKAKDSAGQDVRCSGQDVRVPGTIAFKLYDTYGFPLDMTELLARERGLTVDIAGFEKLMQEQKERSQAAQKKEIIDVAESDDSLPPTTFVGYDQTEASVQIATYKIDLGSRPDDPISARLFFSPSPFYAEMGGQVGDTGYLEFNGHRLRITDTRKAGHSVAHFTPDAHLLDHLEFPLRAVIDTSRRARIEAHHSATHLLHWALRHVLGPTVSQKGSYVGPDRLRFDFSHLEAVKPHDLDRIETLINQHIAAALPVSWSERPYAEVKGDPSILQFFGDKYGDTVRVVNIGGFSQELCAGTHVRNTAHIGPFRILSESAIAAGIRRIEAVAGEGLRDFLAAEFDKLNARLAGFTQKTGTAIPWNTPDLSDNLNALWIRRTEAIQSLEAAEAAQREREKETAKQRQAELQRRAAAAAPDLLARFANAPFLADVGEIEPDYLPILAGELKKSFTGAGLLAARFQGRAHLLAFNFDPASSKTHPAGKLIQHIAPLIGGKGGGRPELAQGSGSNPDAIPDALQAARSLLPPRP